MTCVALRVVVLDPGNATRGTGLDQDVWNKGRDPLGQGVRMIAAAVVSAAVTATIVIAAGQSTLAGADAERPIAPPLVIQAKG